jgi:outer membrane protein assembly factor BamD
VKDRAYRLSLILVIASAVLFSACGGPPKLGGIPPTELFKMGMDKYNQKKFYRSIEVFQTLVYSYAGDTIVASGQYYLAMSYFGNGEYQLAATEFSRLLVNYPSSPFAGHAQFMRAASTYESAPNNYGLDQTELKPSITQLEEFITDHPESEYIPDAKALLLKARTRLARKTYESAIVYTRIEAFESANVYFQKVVDDYTDTEFAPKATYMIAEGYYKMKRYDTARLKFEGFAQVFGKHEWTAKARQRAADAAFRFGLAAFEARDFDKARERFEAFTSSYPGDDRVKKANNYLARIKDQPVGQSQAGKTDS